MKEEVFLFEKKKQKTFVTLGRMLHPAAEPAQRTLCG